MKKHKALEMTLDADVMTGEEVAKKHGVARQTVDRAKVQVNSTPELRQIAAERRALMSEELHDLRVEVLRDTLMAMKASVRTGDLKDIATVYKEVSEHHEVALRVIQYEGKLRDGGRQGGEDSPGSDRGRMATDWPIIPAGQRPAPTTRGIQ